MAYKFKPTCPMCGQRVSHKKSPDPYFPVTPGGVLWARRFWPVVCRFGQLFGLHYLAETAAGNYCEAIGKPRDAWRNP